MTNKLKNILPKHITQYQLVPVWARVMIDAIHALEDKVDMLMGDLNSVSNDVISNTTYRETGKYVTPAGRFKTYSAAARGNKITTYMVKKNIKDENNTGYYIDLDQPTTMPITKP